MVFALPRGDNSSRRARLKRPCRALRVTTPLEKNSLWFMLADMQHTLTLFPSDSSEVESSPAFNVLIAYEDFETGKHAKKTYDFLVENLGRECHLTNQMWKFDVLSIAKLREIAVRDATQADIIILSSHGHDLPEHVIKWIESWLQEGTSSLALVALFQKAEASGGISTTLRDYLAEVARRAHMEFFAQPTDWPGSARGDDSAAFTLGGSDRTLSTLAGVVHRDVATPRWGLNE